jgi:hypothetical protein
VAFCEIIDTRCNSEQQLKLLHKLLPSIPIDFDKDEDRNYCAMVLDLIGVSMDYYESLVKMYNDVLDAHYVNHFET